MGESSLGELARKVRIKTIHVGSRATYGARAFMLARASAVVLRLIGDGGMATAIGPSSGISCAPQKRKSGCGGSPIGHRRIESRSSKMVTGPTIGTTTSRIAAGAGAAKERGMTASAVLAWTKLAFCAA